jgi:hypothetical protein
VNEISDQPAPVPDGKRDKLLEGHCAQLAEHFDSVQIVATWRDSGQTRIVAHGHGNAYAREGSTREWLKVQDERIRDCVRHENDE